ATQHWPRHHPHPCCHGRRPHAGRGAGLPSVHGAVPGPWLDDHAPARVLCRGDGGVLVSGFKGTPGPWELGEDGVWLGSVYSEDGLGIALVYGEGDIDEPRPREEGEANARLIAAAPELLKAL